MKPSLAWVVFGLILLSSNAWLWAIKAKEPAKGVAGVYPKGKVQAPFTYKPKKESLTEAQTRSPATPGAVSRESTTG